METDLSLIEITPALATVIGEAAENTRLYRVEGSHAEMRHWFDIICREVGPCVSPGGVAMYAGVTRAGVYKRIKTGALTAFCFHITKKKKTIFGGEKKLKELPLVYIPVSECQVWGRELEKRGARIRAIRKAKGETVAGDAEDDDRDEDDRFILFDPRDNGKKIRYVTTPLTEED